MEAVKNNPRKYYVALILMLIFVLNDLMFDFLFNFKTSDVISFVFTLAASVIVFTFNIKLKITSKEKSKYVEVSNFIRSNFDNAQVVFSLLDIICGIISLLSGLAFVACVFKILKFIYIPSKIIVVTNKGKTLIKGASKSSLIWTIGRGVEKSCKGEKSKMKKILKSIKNNPKTLIAGFISAVVFGFAGFVAVGQFVTTIPTFAKYIVAIVASVLAFAICLIIGWDNLAQSKLYKASKELLPKTLDTLVANAEAYMVAQEETKKQDEDKKIAAKLAKKEKAVADKQAKADAKEAIALKKKQDKENEKLAKEKAEAERKEYLLKLAAEIQAQEEAKAEVVVEDRPQG